MSPPGTPPVGKAVVVLSSHVVRGAVGNRSTIFALEIFGFQVWAVPTVLLPWHPGHGQATRFEPDPEQFGYLLDDLLESPWFGEVGAILTGYMASAAQAVQIADFVGTALSRNPAILYLCDPVIGDLGSLYVPTQTAVEIRDALLPQAAIATPNLHELAWLTNSGPLATAEAAIAAARSLAPATLLVTSAPAFVQGNTANLLVDKRTAFLAEHRQIAGPANGSGDLVSGLFLARILQGCSPRQALELSSASIFECIAKAAAAGSNELMPQSDLSLLLRPTATIAVRQISTTRLRSS